MYNTSNASSPVSLGKLALQKPGPSYTAMGLTFTTSEPFNLEFSPTYKYLYVVDQYTNPNFNLENYNYFHILNVKDDGTLDEVAAPLALPVENIYRPIGCAVQRVHILNDYSPKS